ncbi:MAG: bifunctional folylpolyglutamate synthase/dihydrofolate synthase [Cyclobacteriaceae bacterium]|nr:bifunctional folylpolyglutamate synthase/dihydrofolate synthase [Cyclobacteriaceae bacterium]
MYQRVGAIAYKKDLTNTRALCEALNNPHHKFKSVHVGGTNGKGSSSHMLAAILQSAGYKTGLYTSPHLKSFTERIRINGKEIAEEYVVSWVNRMQPVLERVKPSFFETTVAMAFDYFATEQVDVAVIEVGLGGRLDSTNVISPVVSLITNIGFDHMDMLGDTLDKIAFEKAGIIKQNTPAIIGKHHGETDEVFKHKAAQQQAPVFFAEDEYYAEGPVNCLSLYKNKNVLFTGINLSLKGAYQKKNIPGVMKTIDVLREQGFQISDEAIIQGLEKTTELTGLKGRWQTISEKPLVICDTAHNEDGIREVVQLIAQQPFSRLFIVLGMVADKQHDKILQLLPRQAHYIFCEANIPRALPAEQLAQKASMHGLTGEVVKNVNEALAHARSLAHIDDFIFIGGSTFVVAELNEL